MNNQSNINAAQNDAVQVAVGGSNFLFQSIWQKGVNSFRKIFL